MCPAQAREAAEKASPRRSWSLADMLLAAGVLSLRRLAIQPGQQNGNNPGSNSRTRPSTTSLDGQLTEAVANALLMIRHATTQGRPLSQDDVRAVLDMSRKLDEPRAASVEEEARFWQATARISSTLAPATIASIRERNRFLAITAEGTTKSIVKQVVNLVISYFIVFVSIILVCIAMHAYYVWIGLLQTEATDSIRKFDDARSALFAAIGSQQSTNATPDSDTLPMIYLNLSAACNALDSWRTTTTTAAKATWDNKLAKEIEQSQSINQDQATSQGSTVRLCSNSGNNTVIDNISFQTLASGLNQLRVVDLPSQKSFRRVGHFRELIGQFVLPLLYGLLGASASFARSLSSALRNVSYSPSFWVDSFFLIPLGALAGATVGIVIAPDALGTGWGITTLGLSFLLGYSVDGFFARLDTMMFGLTNRTSPGTQDNTGTGGGASSSGGSGSNGGGG